MKKTGIIIAILISAFSIAGGGFLSRASADVSGESRIFFVDNSYDDSGRMQIAASLQKISGSAYWYVEDGYWAGLDPNVRANFSAALDDLAAEFDSRIYPKLRELFGTEWNPGIDNDPKLTILLESMRKDAGGYFSPNDEYPKNEILEGRSNEREMIYLNAKHLQNPRTKGFLAHEFQHLITFYQKFKLREKEEDYWLNELRSEYANTFLGYDDDFRGSNLEDRKINFIVQPSDSLTEWRNEEADYAAVALFGEYLADRFTGAIMTKIMQSPAVGIASLNDALRGIEPGLDFERVFGDWLAAIFINDCAVSIRYCYQNPYLKDLKIAPTRIFSVEQGSVNIDQAAKDWTGYWYKADRWPKVLKFDFSGEGANSKFQILFILSFISGKIEVQEMGISALSGGLGEWGTAFIPNDPALIDNVTFVVFNGFKSSGFSADEPATIFRIAAGLLNDVGAPAAFSPTPTASPSPFASFSPSPAPASPSPAPRNFPEITKNLRRGSNGSEVVILQIILNSDPGAYRKLPVTGYYGALTEEAVKKFQCEYNIICYGSPASTGYGKVGPLTRKKINEIF